MSKFNALLDQLSELNVDRVILHSNTYNDESKLVFEVKDKNFGYMITNIHQEEMLKENPSLAEPLMAVFQKIKPQHHENTDEQSAYITTSLNVESGLIKEGYSSFQTRDDYAQRSFDRTFDLNDPIAALQEIDGLNRIHVEYEGGGDSGDITVVEFLDEQGQALSDERDNNLDNNAAESICWSILSKYHGGWENNGGGQGEFSFNLKTGEFTLQHSDNFEEIHAHEEVISSLSQINNLASDVNDKLNTLASTFPGLKLKVTYYGSGDSGDVNDVTLVDDDDEEVKEDLSPEDGMFGETLAYQILSELNYGWENNDGGQGDVTLDLASGEIRLNHMSYEAETSYHETEGKISVELVYDPEVDGPFETFTQSLAQKNQPTPMTP